MDILLICNYWHFEFEKASSRYRTLAEMISESGMDLEVLTSSFRHQTKKQRDINRIEKIKAPYKVKLIYEPGYTKNISLKRLYSHRIFAKNIVKYLKNREKPDLILCSVPSLSVGDMITKFANKNGIKIIIDIQDLWPEAFKIAFNIPILSDIIFYPMKRQANCIYSRADKIMAVSETYVRRGLTHNRHDNKGLSVFIGTDSKLVDNLIKDKEINKPNDEYWIGYIGALGYSYDIRVVIDAIDFINKKYGINNIVFKIMGDGVLKEKFEKYAQEKNIKCDFLGFLDYGTMFINLKYCDVAVNPIVGSSAASIINKVSDYAIAGLPVINTQNSSEYRELISNYNCGINCISNDIKSVADAISKLYFDDKLRNEMGKNALILGTERFDRQKTYKKIIDLIKETV